MFASTMRNHIEKKIPPQRKVDKILNNRPNSPRRTAEIRTKQNQIILIANHRNPILLQVFMTLLFSYFLFSSFLFSFEINEFIIMGIRRPRNKKYIHIICTLWPIFSRSWYFSGVNWFDPSELLKMLRSSVLFSVFRFSGSSKYSDNFS